MSGGAGPREGAEKGPRRWVASSIKTAMTGVLAFSAWWWWAAPPSELEIFERVEFASMDPGLAQVQSLDNGFGSTALRMGEDLPGYDDLVVFADGGALASGMDGWIWLIDLESGRAE